MTSCYEAAERTSRIRLPFNRYVEIVWEPSPGWVWLRRHVLRRRGSA